MIKSAMATTEKMKQEFTKEVNKIPPTTDTNLLAALSYAPLLSLIILLVKRNDDYIKFHAKQGFVLFISMLVWGFPVIGWLIGLLAFIAMLVGFIMAWQGKRYPLPGVAKLASKIPW
ncbi:MAG: hypothetical protein HY092_02545 [Candidatus Kerfeldbacteria bacterium]|nr:hypothetical protein [Candidatus Kerfeldbacteria bacterium]